MENNQKIHDAIFNTLRLLSAVPSRTGSEEYFGKFVETLFFAHLNLSKSSSNVSGVRSVYRNNAYFYSSIVMDKNFPYVFTVHLDRVGRYVNTIREKSNMLSGQLDNIIGIAVLFYLVSLGYKINILLTTYEEACESWPQLEEFIKLHPNMKPISIDIDVYNNVEEFKDNHISLRDKDRGGEFNKPLVEKMRELSDELKIPYNPGTVGWSYVETSMLQYHTGLSGANVGIPIIEYHSPNETTSWDVIYNCVNFLEKFLIKIKGETNASNS